jgi:predicted metal-dependent peptidase
MSDIRTRIDRARWWALTEQPFYGSLAMGLADVLDPSVRTAATDGRVIRWSPEYVSGLTDEQIRYILLHEALHCAHQHLWRLPHGTRGNAAGDHEINLTLQSVPGVVMPEGGLCDPAYRDMACEEILARMPEPPSDGGGGGGGGGGSDQDEPGPEDGQGDPCGSFCAPSADPDPQAPLQEMWGVRVIQAVMAAQASGRGDVPADMQRELDRLRAQHLDWRQELADFVRDAGLGRADWSRSARRHAWQSVIYPRRRPDGLGLVVFARDTSGSIDDRLCAEFSALVSACIAETGCRGLVIDCDKRIQAEHWLEPGDECPTDARGGGGTDFGPVFVRAAELAEHGERIAGIVYLTDLDGPAPDGSDVATLWIATSDRTAPFGRVVRTAT